MDRRSLALLAVAALSAPAACVGTPTVALSDPAPVAAPVPAPWETIDPEFEGCGGSS